MAGPERISLPPRMDLEFMDAVVWVTQECRSSGSQPPVGLLIAGTVLLIPVDPWMALLAVMLFGATQEALLPLR